VADVINDATDGTGMVIADSPVGGPDPLTALFPIHPIQVELVAVNNAENPRALLDPLNETSYCRLDYDAGLREVRVRLPTLGSPGDIVRFDAEIIYRSVGSTANVAFRLLNTVTGLQTSILSLTGSATPRAEGFGSTLGWGGGGGWPANPWQFGDCVLVVDFNAASAGVKVDIFAIGLSCQFRPKRDVLGVFTTTETAYAYFHDRPNFFERVIKGDPGTLRVVPYQVTKEQSVTEIRRSFFCNIEGYADDGSGTYTGLAAGLIELAPDIAQHLLVTYGGQTTAQIERGVGVFGSFVDARAKLKTWHQADMVHALAITEKTDLIRVLAALAEDAACWIYLSRFDDNFHCIPWKAGAAVDFDRTLTKYDLAGKAPVIVMTPDTRVMVGIRVPYGFDYPSGRYLQETLVGSARSLAGHRWRGLRDQQLSVIASGTGQNNKLDFTVVGAGAFTATLATGDYTGPTMRTEVQAAMQAARPDDWVACFGPLVVGGVNAKLQIQEFEGAQNIKIATIAASSYATMEALGTATQSRLNEVSSGFTVSYSRVSRKYTISRSPNNFRIGDINAVPSDHFASVLLGYGRATTAYAAFHVAAFEREEDVFAIGNVTRDVEVNWETGANGLTAGLKNCAALLGFDSTRDSAGGQGSQVGISPKGTLEQALEAARSKYGAKRESSVGGQSIFDSGTARELRNRIADLGRVARPAIILESDYLPDMERGRVFEFDASVDDLKRYAVEGTDGSWAGKKFQATKVIQHAGGDSYLTEVVAVEISAA